MHFLPHLKGRELRPASDIQLSPSLVSRIPRPVTVSRERFAQYYRTRLGIVTLDVLVSLTIYGGYWARLIACVPLPAQHFATE